MTEILESVRLWVEQVIHSLGYVGIGGLMFIENLFPPLPSEMVMPFAGFLVSEGEMSFVAILVAGTVGSGLGAVVIYWLGQRLGERRMRAWLRNYGRYLLLSEADFDQAQQRFERHGQIVVLVGRLIPGIRSFVSIPAGINGMNFPQFLFYTLIGTTIWNSLLAGAGVMLKQNWQRILSFIDTYSTVVWIALGLLVLFFVVRQLFNQQQTPSA